MFASKLTKPVSIKAESLVLRKKETQQRQLQSQAPAWTRGYTQNIGYLSSPLSEASEKISEQFQECRQQLHSESFKGEKQLEGRSLKEADNELNEISMSRESSEGSSYTIQLQQISQELLRVNQQLARLRNGSWESYIKLIEVKRTLETILKQKNTMDQKRIK